MKIFGTATLAAALVALATTGASAQPAECLAPAFDQPGMSQDFQDLGHGCLCQARGTGQDRGSQHAAFSRVIQPSQHHHRIIGQL